MRIFWLNDVLVITVLDQQVLGYLCVASVCDFEGEVV